MKVVIRLSTKTGKTSAHFVGAVSCCGTIMDAVQERRQQQFNKAQGLVANILKRTGEEDESTTDRRG